VGIAGTWHENEHGGSTAWWLRREHRKSQPPGRSARQGPLFAVAPAGLARPFLVKGDVFSDDLIDAWIAYKREAEADHVRLRPLPAQFQLYYDC
jgi:hypothetical protein